MFVTGDGMNFDLNALSALMQLMGKPTSGAKSEPAREQNASISSFAKENGIGQKVEISGIEPQAPASPLSGILEMMGAKPSGNGDAMSALMPMLMNMLKKPESTAKNSSNQEIDQKMSAQDSQNSPTPGSDLRKAPFDPAKNIGNFRTQEELSTDLENGEKFSPIAFAGYALISALNILYHAVAAPRRAFLNT